MTRISELGPEQQNQLQAQIEHQNTGYAAVLKGNRAELVWIEGLNEQERVAVEQRAAQFALEQTVYMAQ